MYLDAAANILPKSGVSYLPVNVSCTTLSTYIKRYVQPYIFVYNTFLRYHNDEQFVSFCVEESFDDMKMEVPLKLSYILKLKTDHISVRDEEIEHRMDCTRDSFDQYHKILHNQKLNLKS